MPFAEYRGGGRLGANVQSMESRWDAEWAFSEQVGDVSAMAENENWPLIKQSIPVGRVLEAGCGIARWVAFLDHVNCEAYGLDYSLTAIEKSLTIWPKLRLSQGDLRAMPYEDCFFDGIISFGAIEHDINGPQAALKDMYRVLKPAGIMYCTVPCMNWIRRAGFLFAQNWIVCNRTIRALTGRKQDVEFFEYVFTRSEYRQALVKAGFEVLDLLPLSPYCLEAKGSAQRRLITAIHKRWPWCQAHMMAAICRKPVEAQQLQY